MLKIMVRTISKLRVIVTLIFNGYLHVYCWFANWVQFRGNKLWETNVYTI